MSMLDEANKIINTPLDKYKKEILLDRLGNIPKTHNAYTPDDSTLLFKDKIKQESISKISESLGMDLTLNDMDIDIDIVYDGYFAIADFTLFLSNGYFDSLLNNGLVVDFEYDVYIMVAQNDKYNCVRVESDDYRKQNILIYDKPFSTIKEILFKLCENKKYHGAKLYENYEIYCDIMNDK